MAMRAGEIAVCRRLAMIAGFLLVLAPSMVHSSQALAGAPAATTSDDILPGGAVIRLGTDRFRQEGEVQQVKYSPDGSKLASISRDAIIIWDARRGRQLQRLRPRNEAAYAARLSALSFSPDGEEIAAAGPSRIYVWEVETGLELLSFPISSRPGFNDSVAIRYSPNGERLAVGGGTSVLLFDTATGKQAAELTIANHRAAFYGPCWAPDGSHLAAGTLNPAVVTWNIESRDLVRRFEVQKGKAFSTSTTFSADGKTLVAATGGVVHFWRFADGHHLKNIELDADFINTLVLTPDSKTLIVGSQDGMIRIVDSEAGKLLRKIDGRLWIGRSLAVSPDFKTVALGAVFPTIRQWNIENGEEAFPELTATGHDAEVQCVACSPAGDLIASGGANKQINLWDADSGKLRLKFPAQSSANRIAFTPSGRHLLTSWQYAGMIRIWDVDTGKEVRTIESGMKKVRAFAQSRDGKQLISVVSDSPYGWHSPVGEETFQVWDLESGAKLREFAFKTASTESTALTVDGTSLVTGAANGIIHVMNVESGKELAMLPGHSHSVNALALSSDGALLASGSLDQSIRLWDAKTWKDLRVLKGHKRAVTSVAFSPDGRILASGSGKDSYPLSPENSQRIRIWDVRSGEQIGAFSGHNTNTSALSFAPNGRRLVSAHDNTTLLIWDVSQVGER
jgi:WD40 repeat protein